MSELIPKESPPKELTVQEDFYRNVIDALGQIANQFTVMSSRIDAMEKQIRLNTPVTSTQEKYLKAAARGRAAELLEKREITETRAVNKLAGTIRKAVLTEFGVKDMRDVPRHEYSNALGNIRNWTDARAVMAVVREARERAAGT